MNAFRGRLLASGGNPFLCSGMFDGMWAGQGFGKAAAPPEKANSTGPTGVEKGQQNTSQTQQQNGGGDRNDNTNDGPNVDDIWKEVQTDDKSKQNDNSQQQQNQQQNNQQQPTAEERIANYLKTQGLEPITLTDQDRQAIKDGNFDDVMAKLNTNITNAHIKAVNAANQLIKNELPKMVEEAVGKSRGYVDTLETRKFLASDPELKPLASDPVLAPNVEAIFKQLLDKGATREQAAVGTKKYFQRLVQKFDPNAQVNTNRGGPYRTPQNSGEIDWLDVLGAPKRS
ncbi:MAG TPA: hypothetical protein VKE92_10120 [Anaerolineales bacterium]|nr:hypothetical protein [Anaerolineales bacterium]